MPDILALLAANPAHYAGMGALVLGGAILQGLGGVGFAMLCAPVALLYFPELVPGPLLAMGGLVSLLTAIRERHEIAWRNAATALFGRIGGTLLAVSVMSLLPGRVFAVVFALCILAAVALSVLGWRVQATTGTLLTAGAASGFMGTLTSAGAPPFAIVMQHLPPARVRATIGAILTVGSAVSITMLAATGHYGLRELQLSLLLLPLLLCGFSMSSRLRHHLSPAHVRRLLLGLCAAGALGILVRAV
ncbi:sulfite exporter TauE/SafE family protein [Verticiella sediminum]|uniref:Probable membrane transporter protein n=1 Tax=Verticiella sediminum TaxID=1247510 RepID=A0A556AC90_9BURK|nr:sulfite exporter TauE/SafE family protein [Verticiella sediminum]TSH90505.1 sulfite exporter TauE/SafE family protein [Verticiella sediminum]